MDGWSIVLLVLASLVAVLVLVRLMVGRRDQLLADFRRRMRAAPRTKPARRKVKPPQEPPKEAA